MTSCPHCGQTMPETVEVKLSPGQRRIVDLVTRAGPNGIMSDRLFDLVYADDRDGGPLTGRDTLATRIYHINRRLRPIGKKISAGRGSGPQAYVIQTTYKRPRRGERKLTDGLVTTIRKMYATGEHTQVALAKKFNVSQGHISVIIHYKAWQTYREGLSKKYDEPLSVST